MRHSLIQETGKDEKQNKTKLVISSIGNHVGKMGSLLTPGKVQTGTVFLEESLVMHIKI